MDIDVAERHLAHEVEPHHHHPGDPEEDDVEAGDEHRSGVIALQLWRLVRPAHGREWPQRGGEPSVEHILIAPDRDCFAIEDRVAYPEILASIRLAGGNPYFPVFKQLLFVVIRC